MSLTDQQGESWNCKRCDFELVEIKKNTIDEIIRILNPNFLSLPLNWKFKKSAWIRICPRCDSHPLGFETEHVFPIRTKSGDKTTINDLYFVKAHKHHDNREEILNSEKGGCFYCLEIFSPGEIIQWHGEDEQGIEQIAICPRCSVDSVIGDASGFPIETAFLSVMRDFWFSPNEWSKTIGATAMI
jgi:hypothetical protein